MDKNDPRPSHQDTRQAFEQEFEQLLKQIRAERDARAAKMDERLRQFNEQKKERQ